MRRYKAGITLAVSALLAVSLGISAPNAAAQNAQAQNAQAQNTQAQNTQAQNPQGQIAPFTDPRNVEADLARIDASLNATTSFSGRFAQYGADGSFAQGTIYLRRPGKLRFEYDAPNPLLIVSDGVTLAQQDRALETLDRVPLASTPLNFFLKENVRLARDTEVTSLIKTYNEIRVTARDGSGDMDGAITLVFDGGTLALKEWIIADNFGGQTRVILSDLRYNVRINPRLFVLRDQNRGDRRR